MTISRTPKGHRIPRKITRAVLALMLGATLVAGPAAAAGAGPRHSGSVSLRLISFNDLHGNLEPPSGSSGRVTLSDGSTVDAGGVAYLATHVKQLRAQARNSLVVSGGDNIGASPLPSALFHDEPTIDALNAIGVRASAVGNHEFDEGYAELRRIQVGGCHPTDGCEFESSFPGARFPILGANVTRTNGLPALLPFSVEFVDRIPVAFIGITLKGVPDVVVPSAVKGLAFGDEVAAINRTSRLLAKFGVKAQVVLMHQGDDSEGGGPNDCNIDPAAHPATLIAKRSTAQVDAFVTGHTHQQYNCTLDDPSGQPRPVIQAASFGRLLSVLDFKIDTRTRDVVRSATKAKNVVVTRDVAPDPAVSNIVQRAVTESAPIANEQVGSITADLLGRGSRDPEIPLGDVIADAQLAATQPNGAQIAITNPGGIRGDLSYASSPAGEGDGVVTYGEAFAVQPFSNIMQTITLTGAQLEAVLEQQADNPGTGQTRFLQISDGLSYTWNSGAVVGSKVSDLTLNGTPIAPGAPYRVSVNNFLASGGDGFSVFAEGTDLTGGPIDLDAFVAYLLAHPKLSPPPADRITVVQ